MQKKVSKRFQQKVEGVFHKNRRGRPSKENQLKTLETLIGWLKGMRSAIRRLESHVDYLQEVIVDLMNRLGLREYSFGQTTAQKIVRLQISDKKSYEKVKKILGEKRAREWIKIEKKKIPARIETHYIFTEEGLEKIKSNSNLEKKIIEVLNAPEYIIILRGKKRVS